MIPESLLYPYCTVLIFFFGICFGSFLNVCIYRIPLEQSVVTPGSHCFRCNHAIAWYDNIPLVSYLLLRGHCRNCNAGYSPRYFLVEALTGILFLLVWLHYGGGPENIVFDPRIPVYWLVIFGLLLGTFVDFDHLIIPDRVSIGGMITGVIMSVVVPSLHGADTWHSGLIQSLVGLGFGFGTLQIVAKLGKIVFKQDAMGFGDVKLLGAIGAYLGWKAVFFTILISSFVGAIVGIALVLLKGREWQSRIPYGPYLSLAAIIWITGGHVWWQLYVEWITSVRL